MNKIKINNGFRSLDVSNSIIFAVEILEGTISNGQRLVINSNCFLEIEKIEVTKYKEIMIFISQKAIARCRDMKTLKLYGEVFELLPSSSSGV